MVQNFTDYTGYPVPQDTGPAEPQLDGPSGGEMEAPAALIVADDWGIVKGTIDWAPPSGKQRILDAINATRLVADAKMIASNLADNRDRVNGLKAELAEGRTRITAELAEAREVASLVEATIMQTDAFLALKNDAQRKGWLLGQRHDNPTWRYALEAVEVLERVWADASESIGRQITEAEASHETMSRDYQLALAEIRLAAAQLLFLAGGD